MERSLVVGLVPGGSTKQATITITWTLTAQEAPAPSRADPWAEDPAVQYNVERINEYRARAHLPPLLYDAQIAAFARTGSARLSRDHVPHANFVENGRGAPGFSSRLGENQGDPNGVPAMSTDPVENWRLQIDFMLKLMMDEGRGGGHHDNIMNSRFRRVGVGLVHVGGRLYMTNDFSD